MAQLPQGTIAVIFVAQRTDADATGYARAAAMMETLAVQQKGYIAMDSVRGSDGLGITVSYWTDEANDTDTHQLLAAPTVGQARPFWRGDDP